MWDSNWTGALWRVALSILSCKAWLEISRNWRISGRLNLKILSALHICVSTVHWILIVTNQEIGLTLMSINYLNSYLFSSSVKIEKLIWDFLSSVMMLTCRKLWKKQQKLGGILSLPECQRMQAHIILSRMILFFFVMEGILITHMVDSFLVGTRMCWLIMVTLYYHWPNWPLKAHAFQWRFV